MHPATLFGRLDVPSVSRVTSASPVSSKYRRVYGEVSPDVLSISLAAPTTSCESRWPGLSPRREIGPLILTAALSLPSSPKTGALTLATPASLSATLSAQPLIRIPLSSGAFGLLSTPASG